eukprot:4225975-Prymnesium_polylepis.2
MKPSGFIACLAWPCRRPSWSRRWPTMCAGGSSRWSYDRVVMYTIGALLRALQQTTALQYIFNPSCGIAAGINLLCLWSNAKWPAAIILGWVTSSPYWAALGDDCPAAPPIPIFHANTLPVNLTHPVGTEGANRPLHVKLGIG